jgi:hypothetical protein
VNVQPVFRKFGVRRRGADGIPRLPTPVGESTASDKGVGVVDAEVVGDGPREPAVLVAGHDDLPRLAPTAPETLEDAVGAGLKQGTPSCPTPSPVTALSSVVRARSLDQPRTQPPDDLGCQDRENKAIGTYFDAAKSPGEECEAPRRTGVT